MKIYNIDKTNQSEQLRAHLNEEQESVVFADDGPHLVIAGAGSGKTRTLTYRVARLINDGIPVERILLCTFTNKAAHEMISRIEFLTSESLNSLWAGTFHHIANKILKNHPQLLGFDEHFTILDIEDSAQLIDQISKSLDFSGKGKRFPKGRSLYTLFSYARAQQIPLDDFILTQRTNFIPLLDQIIDVWNEYTEKKREFNVMDFDDLLDYWLQLLQEFPNIRDYYSDYFLHILVDEYQDTNPIQVQIIDLLASKHQNLTVVGDDAQSIYSFRGADATHILDFPERYPSAQIHYLRTNYRSRPEILFLSNHVIAHNQRQFEKELHSHRPNGPLPILVISKNSQQESEFISQHIQELLEDKGEKLKNIAILYRTHNQSLDLQLALQKKNIPFKVRSGMKFFEKSHIKDILSFLRVSNNPKDGLAWHRLLPLFPSIGKKISEKIFLELKENDFQLKALEEETFTSTLPKNAQRSLKRILHLLDESHELSDNPSEMIWLFLDQEYQDYLNNTFEDAEARQEDIDRLASFALNYQSTHELLDEMALFDEITERLSASGELIYDDEEEDEDDALILTTVHQAKGLEWKYVFLLDLRENSFPFFLSIKEDNLEEERRLFYVALTRAKEQLYLLFSRFHSNKRWPGGYAPSKPSSFLWESFITPEEVEELPSHNDLPNFLKFLKKYDEKKVDLWIVDPQLAQAFTSENSEDND